MSSFIDDTELVAKSRGDHDLGASLTIMGGYSVQATENIVVGLQGEGSLLRARADQQTTVSSSTTSTSQFTSFGSFGRFSSTSVSSSSSTFNGRLELEPTWLISLLGRAGFLLGPDTLLYGVAGVSYGGFDTDFGTTVDRSFGSEALTIGLGVERRFSDSWGLTADYRFHHFGTKNLKEFDSSSSRFVSGNSVSESFITSAETAKIRGDIHVIRVGMSRYFH